MRKIGAEIASGVAIFFALIVFIFGFLFLKNTAFKGGHRIFVSFSDVTGLEPNDAVNVSGYKIGQVEDFQLRDLIVIVELLIDETIQLPKDSKIQIKSLGLVGEKFVDIVPGESSEMLEDGAEVQGVAAGDFSQLAGSAEGLLDQARQLLDHLLKVAETVLDETTQKDVKESLMHASSISSSLDATLQRNTESIEETLASVNRLARNMDELLAGRRQQIEESIGNLHAASQELEGLTARVDSSLSSMQEIMARIQDQEGTVGKLIYNDEMYNDLRKLQAEIDELLVDLKRYPQKYVNLKVF